MVDQGTAADLALGDDDLYTKARQQPDGRLVDGGIENGLRTAGEDRDATTAFGLWLMPAGLSEGR
ncbi:hypothetical protein D3C72_2526490 [compost metagenome]